MKPEDKDLILKQLSEMPIEALSIAYVYAKNIETYNIDITDKWTTASKQAIALQTAYGKGYYEGLQVPSQIEKEFQAIGLELLQKYILAEEIVIGELSGDFHKSKLTLQANVKNYLQRLHAEDKYAEITENHWIFEIDEE